MKLSALTVLQPWAGFIVSGMKPVENRDWRTTYRGPLLIHAGKRTLDPGPSFLGRVAGIHDGAQFVGRVEKGAEPGYELGAVVGITTLVNCRRSTMTARPTDWHDEYGVWWELTDAVRLTKPLPMRGQRMIWTADIDENTFLDGKWKTIAEYVRATHR